MLLYAGHDAPMDGVEELIVALHDIAQVLSRPTLARLTKIGQVAEQVASAPPAAAAGPGRAHQPPAPPWAPTGAGQPLTGAPAPEESLVPTCRPPRPGAR